MSMLELITAGRDLSAAEDPPSSTAAFPLPFNADFILSLLKPADDSPSAAPLHPLAGWKIPDADAKLSASTGRLSSVLRRQLVGPKPFPREEFLRLLIDFVEENGEKLGPSMAGKKFKSKGDSDAAWLAARVAALVVAEIGGLVCECCAAVESWSLLEALVSVDVVKGSSFGGLLRKLIEKKKTWLLWLSVKKIADFRPTDLAAAMKYFLSLPSAESTKDIKSEWEVEAINAMEKVKGENGKQEAILTAMAYDGFYGWEMVLHCLLGSLPADGPAMGWAVAELESCEVVKYLAKWLEKYESFPGIGGPCLENGAAVVPAGAILGGCGDLRGGGSFHTAKFMAFLLRPSYSGAGGGSFHTAKFMAFFLTNNSLLSRLRSNCYQQRVISDSVVSGQRGFHVELGAREKALLEEDPALKRFKSFKKAVWRLKLFSQSLLLVAAAMRFMSEQ